jgi:CelD/BcsL family acetyltransferase involved in cellulose biosynthesis
MSDLNLEVLHNLESCRPVISSLRSPNRRDNPFLTMEWLTLWWEYFGKGKTPHLICWRENGQTVGLAPFYRVNRPHLRVAEFHLIGAGFSSYLDLMSLAGYEERILDSLFDHFRSLPFMVIANFYDLNDRFSQFYPFLLKKGRAHRSSAFLLYSCPQAKLAGSWESFFNKRHSKTRNTIKRKIKRLTSKFGELAVREITESRELDALFPKLERIHHERFQGTLHPLFQGQKRLMLREALNNLLGRLMSLSIAELAGEPVSFVIGFNMSDTYIFFAPAFDPAFAGVSVGQLHLLKLMETKLLEGFKIFDFCKGDLDYKRPWSDDETRNYLFRFRFNSHPIGEAYFNGLNGIRQLVQWSKQRGYYQKIKRWAARLTKGDFFGRSRTAIRVDKIDQLPVANNILWERFTYHCMRELPIEVRTEIVNAVIKSKVALPWMAPQPEKRQVLVANETRSAGLRLRF